MGTYTNSVEGFEVSCPTSWHAREPDGTNPAIPSDMRVILFAPPEKGHNDSVNIVVHHGVNPPPLPVLLKGVIGELSKQLNSFKLEEQSDLQLDGHEAISIVFSGQVAHGPVRQKQYSFLNGPILYTLTYTAAPETFAKNLPAAEEVVRSIHIKK